jgi:hypothetical protein
MLGAVFSANQVLVCELRSCACSFACDVHAPLPIVIKVLTSCRSMASVAMTELFLSQPAMRDSSNAN